jgi:hypothetical protein
MTDSKYWFKQVKTGFRLGFYWRPVNRAGWLVILAYVLGGFLYPLIVVTRGMQLNPLIFVAMIFASTIGLLTAIMYKGEPVD